MGFDLGQKIIDTIRRKKYRGRISYSQQGEDVIVEQIMQILGIKKVNYLDIGAHHSSYLSNTKYFYNKGGHGVLIEPDPVLFKEIESHRKKDICLNAAIGFNDEEFADFYLMEQSPANTLSKEEAEYLVKNKISKIKKIIKTPLLKVNSIIETYFPKGVDFMSLDVEGIDLDVLKSIDFNKYRPKVVCVETADLSPDNKELKKEYPIIDFMKEQDYFIYADTSANTIFVDNKIW